MWSVSLWDDLSNLSQISLRLGFRLAALIIATALLHQAYHAFRSASLGINTYASRPMPEPTSGSSRFRRAVWGLVSLAVSTVVFLGAFGFDVPAMLLWPWSH